MDTLSRGLQEDILTSLCYNASLAPVLVNNIDAELFDNTIYRRIAEKAILFYKNFNTPIGDHLPDALEKELTDSERGPLYKKVIIQINESKDGVVGDYVLERLNSFTRKQRLKITIKEVVDLVQKEKLEEAESLLYDHKKNSIDLFDPGTFLIKDKARSLNFFQAIEQRQIHTGIDALDKLGHMPTKGEMFTLLGRAGSFKSWFCVYIAKMAMLQRWKVLYVTLELSEDRLKPRMYQAIFGIASKLDDLQKHNAILTTDPFGRITNIDFKTLPSKLKYMTDDDIIEYLEKRGDEVRKPNLLIKEFATGVLTVSALEAYLENLEAYYGWRPDLVITDYMGLMYTSIEHRRLELEQIGIQLRGMAVRRDFAWVNVFQTNRVAEGVPLITRQHLGEDFSPVKTSDCLITSNCTSFEKEHGLLRIYIDKGRNGRDGDIILLSQNISIGQYHLNSALIKGNKYKDILKDLGDK